VFVRIDFAPPSQYRGGWDIIRTFGHARRSGTRSLAGRRPAPSGLTGPVGFCAEDLARGEGRVLLAPEPDRRDRPEEGKEFATYIARDAKRAGPRCQRLRPTRF